MVKKYGWRKHKPEFRMKNIDETGNYFLEERKQNESMSRKHKTVCTILNYMEHFLILAELFNFLITTCISIYDFDETIWFTITIKIRSFAIGLKICAIAAGIRKYKSIINKKKNKCVK